MARSIARAVLGGIAASALGLSGCAGTYDMVTSERFKERPFHTMFTREDPVKVLATVQEGDDRVRAMHDLEEPKEHGGSAADQDRMIGILQTSATTEQRPLCRLAAVNALTKFEDPRAGAILIAAFNNAAFDGAQAASGQITPAASFGSVNAAVSQFAPDTVTSIQCLALEGLGKHRSAESLNLLVQVASTRAEKPKPKPSGVEPAGGIGLELAGGISEPDRVDVRLAAIRSLGNYDKDPTAIRTLVGILRTDKDVAVRGRAHESLVKITGQDLPADGEAWARWMERGSRR